LGELWNIEEGFTSASYETPQKDCYKSLKLLKHIRGSGDYYGVPGEY
jgi:hypothetical protein